jgi:hypothetical protein
MLGEYELRLHSARISEASAKQQLEGAQLRLQELRTEVASMRSMAAAPTASTAKKVGNKIKSSNKIKSTRPSAGPSGEIGQVEMPSSENLQRFSCHHKILMMAERVVGVKGVVGAARGGHN